MKIAIAGIGYVGLSNAILLAQHNDVTIVDIVPGKVEMLNRKQSPIVDADIEHYLKYKPLKLKATLNANEAYTDADVVIIATPTDYDPQANYFNTGSVEQAIADVVAANKAAIVVIKSTIPLGFTRKMSERYPDRKIVFSPEFLREGRALHDNLHPTRIVVGDKSEIGLKLVHLFKQGANRTEVPTLLTDSTEAEAIKLFANSFLAMRVAYFNELDTYAEANNLDARQIIEGISLDSRIGSHYNNPSFGYGGYCLPKDTRQLLATYGAVPQQLIKAIVDSNETRMDFIAAQIRKRCNGVLGVYRLIMKAGSDNVRASSMQGVINRLHDSGMEILIYEPTVTDPAFMGLIVLKDLADFKSRSKLILTNRMTDELLDVEAKVYTRDIFGNDR